MFEDVGYVSTFRVVIIESDTFVVVLFVFVWVLRCICAVSLAMSRMGNLLLFTMLHILPFCYSPFSSVW